MSALHHQYPAWGKLDRSASELRCHPLIDHMLDVASCFEALSKCTGIRRALNLAAERDLDKVDIARLCAIAFLHDIGKANAGFQSRR
jgi:CRISPR-associated endonuclease/helicase Cas3